MPKHERNTRNVQVYNRALSAAEVTRPYKPGTALVKTK